MAHKALIPFLVGMMLLTGVCNTLLQKYQDMQCIENCNSPDPSRRKNFEQPIWQTIQMFIGESGCWIFVAASSLISRYRGKRTDPSAAGYQPLNTAEDTVHDDTITVMPGGGTRESAEAAALLDDGTDPAAKPLTPDPSTAVRHPLKGWRVIMLALPAVCDCLATTLMNLGLLFVAASIYQMTRGALVLFVGLFSVLFLGRYLPLYKWMALFIVVGGVAIVGLAGYIEHSPTTAPINPPPPHGRPHDSNPISNAIANLGSTPSVFSGIDTSSYSVGSSYTNGYNIDSSYGPSDHLSATYSTIRLGARALHATLEKDTPLAAIVGVSLTALAQIFTAFQFVAEELIMHRYSLSPLNVVGWEGTFGLLISFAALGIGHAAYGRTPQGQGGYFDAVDGWHQMVDDKRIAVSSLLIMVSIGSFNYFGLSVTRSVSATARSTIDTCRTLFIWVVSLGLGWESFKWLQIVGFVGLVYGTFLFNDVVRSPRAAGWLKAKLSRARSEG